MNLRSIKTAGRTRANVLGVGVDAVNIQTAAKTVADAIESNRKGYVCVTGVHGVVESQKNNELKNIINNSLMTTPDGMPAVWVGKLQGHSIDRVYGPEMMLEICRKSVEREHTHFLYGGNTGVVEELAERLRQMFPGIRITGGFTPPFRPLDAGEEAELVARVANLKPDIFWVGLSTPKQEKFMAEYIDKLDTKVMLGVGAAFDIHTGKTKDSPAWIKRIGLQWFHRLLQEPRRLGKRYFVIVPVFLTKIALQLLTLKKYPLPTLKS